MNNLKEDETWLKLEEPIPSKSLVKTMAYRCQKCKKFVNKEDKYCKGCGRRIKYYG